MDLLVLGANHTTAPVEVRDEVAMDADNASDFVQRIRENHAAVAEIVVLSTCNRTELYASTMDVRGADRTLREAIGCHKGVPHFSNGDYTYLRTGRGAARHLFRVASGLDSLMLGEQQILGQVKDALSIAERNGGSGAPSWAGPITVSYLSSASRAYPRKLPGSSGRSEPMSTTLS